MWTPSDHEESDKLCFYASYTSMDALFLFENALSCPSHGGLWSAGTDGVPGGVAEKSAAYTRSNVRTRSRAVHLRASQSQMLHIPACGPVWKLSPDRRRLAVPSVSMTLLFFHTWNPDEVISRQGFLFHSRLALLFPSFTMQLFKRCIGLIGETCC